MSSYDLLIIGGGINGAGLARDAAGRGLAVALIEAGDLASGTSSASTKLVHGGLRYLEFGALSLVRKALSEREVVLAQAPHLGRPLGFLLPEVEGGRSRPALTAGLTLYDLLASHKAMPKSTRINLQEDQAGPAFRPDIRHAFRYYDGSIDDARLVIANARDAAARGATIVTHSPATQARRTADGWEVEADGETFSGRMLVNAGGPFAHEIGKNLLQLADPPELSLVQGAHIATRRINRGPDAWMLQQPDQRIIFVIPWAEYYSLIGTTETPIESPHNPQPTNEEISYLLEAVNRVLQRPLTPDDIVHSFAGIRPLVAGNDKSPRETTREWKLVEHDPHTLSIIGGKLTTYRLLAEDVLRKLAPRTRRWTKNVPLPGGNIPRNKGRTVTQDFDLWLLQLKQRHPDYDPIIVERLAHLFGTEANDMLTEGLGKNFDGVFEAELAFMRDKEWAKTAEDALWRHSKLGLSLSMEAKEKVRNFFGEQL